MVEEVSGTVEGSAIVIRLNEYIFIKQTQPRTISINLIYFLFHELVFPRTFWCAGANFQW